MNATTFRRFTAFAAVLVSLLALLIPFPSAAADGDGDSDSDSHVIMLILDASGSMWGQVEGGAKIGIAKEAMRTLITQLPERATVGLILYGHRSTGDCDDVEVVIPPGPLDRTALVQAVDGINPKGKTPLARSIRAAVELLQGLPGERTVILVSDGKETCDPDPCAATRKLRESGVELMVHVIGFDIADDERGELECIAAAGGGKYFSAADAEDLVLAAATATNIVEQAPATGDGRLWFDGPARFTAAARFEVNFEAADTFHENAWIGVLPATVEHGSEARNDEHDLGYAYVKGRTSGKVTLTAPATVGRYDVRLHDSDNDGREVASADFEVVEATGRVWTDRTEFMAGEEITVHFAAATPLGGQAWIGIVPADIPHGSASENDQHDVSYSYLDGQPAGSVTLHAPTRAGAWDARLHDSDAEDGNEIAAQRFTVTVATAELKLDRHEFAPGETIIVHYTVPESLPSDAWVGIVPSAVPHIDESTNDDNNLDYRHLADKPTGTVEIDAPDEPGAYDLRLNDTDDDGNEIASVSFTVR